MKYDTQYFKLRVKEKVGEEYSVLGEYVDYNHTRIKMRHNICGYEYEILPSSFLGGTRCAKCAGLLRYSTESFKEKVRDIVGNEYIVLGEYAGNKVKIMMQHMKCGTEYMVKPNAFLSGNRCPVCQRKRPYTQSSFEEKIFSIFGDEYAVIGNYKNTSSKIRMRHNLCGHEYDVVAGSVISGRRCPKCFQSVKYTTDEYKEKVFDVVGDRYSVLDEYVNAETSITLRHNICGHIYQIKPLMFFQGNRCPKCSTNLKRSLPEEIVAYFVSQYFEIIQGFHPDWLEFKNHKKGEIDIWIPSLSVAIEYDGVFHNSPEGQARDRIKNSIILSSGMCSKLIRIREHKTVDIQKPDTNLVVIAAQKTIGISSSVGIDELERVITLLLAELGISENVEITKEIINACQQKAIDYYVELGKPAIRNVNLSRRSTTEEFKHRVQNLVGDEYTVLGEYTRALDNILLRHNICGYEYSTRPNSFLTGRRCPNCAGKIRYTSDIFAQKLYSIVGDEFQLLGEYVDSKTKVRAKHTTCGYEFYVNPTYLLTHHSCPRCSKRVYYTTDSFKGKICELYGNEYSLVGEYIPSAHKIRLKHNVCDTEYEVVPSSFLAGHRCPQCFRSTAYTTEEFRQKILSAKGGHYELVGEYISSKNKIRIVHNDCGGVYEVTPHHFLKKDCKCKICGK